jgi:hypothetical protein
MINLKQKEAFRLAAVLYAENNYLVNPATIHRKIIESVFLDNDNDSLSIHNIIDKIESNYNFVFGYEEVERLVVNDRKECFLVTKDAKETLAKLTPSRLTLLQSKIKSNNIDYFIDEFIKGYDQILANVDSKSIIYKFLYDVFKNNISSFTKLTDYKIEVKGSINIDDSFNSEEKEIINSFLQWENDGKNKAIFDISSYSLEYCLITNNETKQTFQLQNLKNKDFYLDTNVLFRAIGINGESRAMRTITFLRKFNEAAENNSNLR